MTNYKSPFFKTNGHVDTLVPFFCRKKKPQPYARERLQLNDGDFLDLDWIKQNSKKLIILSHGLESCTQTQYILGMADIFRLAGFDILAWNCRGCSGEMNRSKFYYHSGVSWDLRAVVDHALKGDYREVSLIGFSMGGNITLKYIGEEGVSIDKRIKKSCVFSTPIDLSDASDSLGQGASMIYTRNFLKTLRKKIIAKKEQFPELPVDLDKLDSVQTMKDFDQHFTAPMFGYKSANDYYQDASSYRLLKDISIKTLIVNAQNDPFLSGKCYPIEEVSKNKYLKLEIPLTGGHCGFYNLFKKNILWSEKRAFEFITNDEVSTC